MRRSAMLEDEDALPRAERHADRCSHICVLLALCAEITHTRCPSQTMSDDQSNIPTKVITVPGAGEPSQGERLTDSQIGAMLGAGIGNSSSQWEPPSPEELQGD